MATILEKSGFNPDKKLKIVGTSPMRHDGFEKVTGRSKFSADIILPGMLWGKISEVRMPTRPSSRSTPRRQRRCPASRRW